MTIEKKLASLPTGWSIDSNVKGRFFRNCDDGMTQAITTDERKGYVGMIYETVSGSVRAAGYYPTWKAVIEATK